MKRFNYVKLYNFLFTGLTNPVIELTDRQSYYLDELMNLLPADQQNLLRRFYKLSVRDVVVKTAEDYLNLDMIREDIQHKYSELCSIIIQNKEVYLGYFEKLRSNILECNIQELGLSTYAYNCLLRNGITKIEQLTHKTYTEPMSMRGMGDTEIFDYVDANGETKQKRGITYNPKLRTALLGVMSGCILKVGQRFGENKYEHAYREYRDRLDNMPRHEGKSDGQKHKIAVRFMVKEFLRDLWVEWRTYEGYEISEPYEVAYLGRKPHKYNEAHVKRAAESKA